MLLRPFDRLVREKKFLRTLPKDDVGAFLRSGLEAEFKEPSLTPKSAVLTALQAVETELRKRAASKPDDPISRQQALHSLGPVEHANELTLPGHVQRSAPGKGIWNEAKEQPITVRFVPCLSTLGARCSRPL